MSAQQKRQINTIFRVDPQMVKKMLATIASHGINETGSQTAVRFAKMVFFAKTGNEKRPITAEEAGELIKEGYK